MKIYDLIYESNEARKLVENAFPNAKIEDASDQAHEERFSVEMEIELIDWLEWVARNGLAGASLTFNVKLRQNEQMCIELTRRLNENPIKEV